MARASAHGADGLFFATQTAAPEVFDEAEFAQWDLPLVRRVLEGVHHRSSLTLLHGHGRDVFFDRLAALPVHALNWHDRVTKPGLAEARERFAGALVGGIDEWHTLRHATPQAIADEVREAVRQTGGLGHVVGPGCVVPLDVRDESLEAAVSAVKRSQR